MSFELNNVNDQKLITRLNSYQFKLSQKIFSRRIHLGLCRDEAAKFTKLSLKQYTKMEQGIDLDSSEEDYLRVLIDLKRMQTDDSNENVAQL